MGRGSKGRRGTLGDWLQKCMKEMMEVKHVGEKTVRRVESGTDGNCRWNE